jgi:ankyrin repeat protein
MKSSSSLYGAASMGNDVASIRAVLATGDFHIDAVANRGGFTALHLAARGGHDLVVQELVSLGANVNIRDEVCIAFHSGFC